MRALVLAPALLAGCVAAPRPRAADTRAAVAAAAPRPLPVERTPCPLTPGPIPACGYTPVDGAGGGAVRRVARTTCQLGSTPTFVLGAAVPTLSLVVTITEGSSSFGATALHQVDGVTQAVPPSLMSPMRVGGALVGLAFNERAQAFWRDGSCELPGGLPVLSIAPLGPDGVVALLETPDHGRAVAVRDASGAWATYGAVPRGVEPRFAAASARVVVHYEDSGHPWEYGALFPDLGRTEVVRRTDVSPAVMPHPAIAPEAPRPGSRFSSGVYAELDGARKTLVVDRLSERGVHARLAVATLEPLPGCRQGEAGRARFRAHSSPAIAMLGDGTALVALVEDGGECEAVLEPPAPVRCQPGEPCHPQPPRWRVTELGRDLTLVLWAVGDGARELLRVRLGDGQRAERVFTGVSLAVTDDRAFAWAAGHLVELELRALGVGR